MAAYLAVNKNGDERIFEECPTYHRLKEQWVIETEWETTTEYYYGVPLPKGSIKKLIGKDLTVIDEPFLIE